MTEPALIRDDPPSPVLDFHELLQRPAWHAHALCHGRTELFFDVPPGMGSAVHLHRVRREFCDRCPVQAKCREAGRDEAGIWGGGR